MNAIKAAVPRVQATQGIDDAPATISAKAAWFSFSLYGSSTRWRSRLSTWRSAPPRYATELDLPGLRVWSFKRFPYLIFYVERDDRIDIWRVLHAKRDVPTGLADGGEDTI